MNSIQGFIRSPAGEFGYDTMAAKWKSVADKIKQNFKLLVNPDTNTLRKSLVYDAANDQINFDDTLDASSFYGVMTFFDDDSLLETLKATIAAVENQLSNQQNAHGVARYPGDGYFRNGDHLPSNAWPLCTMWLAQYYLHTGDPGKAKELLNIVESDIVGDGILSEQIASDSGLPTSVSPLVWAHAEYLNTIIGACLSH